MSRPRRTAVPRRAALSSGIALGIALSSGTAARAQSADAPAALPPAASTADSVQRLDALAAAVRRDRHDGALWHEKGMLAWALVYRHQQDAFISRREDIAHLHDADEALRMATQESPDSARYWLDLQAFLLHSAAPSARSAAGRVARDAAAAAERSGDRPLLAEAYDREGMRAWRNYEALSRRDLGGRDVAGGTLEPAEFDPAALAAINRSLTGDTENDFGGETDYRRAEVAFDAAVRANPKAPAPRRHLYMLLAERGKWDELRTTALARTSEAPDEADGWLALGLAAHRLSDDETSTRAFDRGLSLLPVPERERLTSLVRILPPHPAAGRVDSATFTNATPTQRAALERAYWTLADPVTLTPVNEHRLEFYARVVTAELMWTVDEAGIRGADTERGDVLVRFGPPALVLRLNGTGVDQVTEWRYPYKRFYFRTPGGFGTGTLVSESFTLARDYRESVPVSWRDAPAVRPDSVPLQVARFRAGGDSVALYVSAALPVRALAAGVARGSASVDVGFTLFDAGVRAVLRDSARVRVSAADAPAADVRSWRGTLAPGEYGVRVEGLGVASRRAAAGRADVSLGTARGFGVSDLLLAASVQPGAAGGTRWTDYSAVPNAGVFKRGQPVAMLWETYALAAGADGTARYRVTVSVEPLARGRVVAFLARVLGGTAGAVGLSGRSSADGRLTLAFDRQAPARDALADYLTLDLGGAPAGRYTVRVSVEDTATHTSAATFATLQVVE